MEKYLKKLYKLQIVWKKKTRQNFLYIFVTFILTSPAQFLNNV